MDLDKIITLAFIALSLVVLGLGMFAIRYYDQQQEPLVLPDTNWDSIEQRVENDIGTLGYQFLVKSMEGNYGIPAINRQQFENCLQVYAELRLADEGLTLEYLAKYNQIVRIRMLRAGIDCQEHSNESVLQ